MNYKLDFTPATKHLRGEYIEIMIKTFGYRKVAELGLSGGATTLYLLENTDLDLYIGVDCMDIETFTHAQGFPLEELNTKYPHFKFMNDTTNNSSLLVEGGSLDLVFIDADHSDDSTTQDIKDWWPKVREGGILCGHDYGHYWPEVAIAVNRIFGANIHVLPEGTSNGFWWLMKGKENEYFCSCSTCKGG